MNASIGFSYSMIDLTVCFLKMFLIGAIIIFLHAVFASKELSSSTLHKRGDASFFMSHSFLKLSLEKGWDFH